MKKFILIGALVLASSGAFAQSSQGQGGAQAGTNGNAATTPNSATTQNGMREGDTTGINGGAPSGGVSSSQPHQPSATGPPPQAPATTR
jgi:hypothetical protein